MKCLRKKALKCKVYMLIVLQLLLDTHCPKGHMPRRALLSLLTCGLEEAPQPKNPADWGLGVSHYLEAQPHHFATHMVTQNYGKQMFLVTQPILKFKFLEKFKATRSQSTIPLLFGCQSTSFT